MLHDKALRVGLVLGILQAFVGSFPARVAADTGFSPAVHRDAGAQCWRYGSGSDTLSVLWPTINAVNATGAFDQQKVSWTSYLYEWSWNGQGYDWVYRSWSGVWNDFWTTENGPPPNILPAIVAGEQGGQTLRTTHDGYYRTAIGYWWYPRPEVGLSSQFRIRWVDTHYDMVSSVSLYGWCDFTRGSMIIGGS